MTTPTKTLRRSDACTRTVNPIRRIVDSMKAVTPSPDKPLISLSIGDPTIDGNLLPPPAAEEAIVVALKGQRNNGYNASFGSVEARRAVADFWREQYTAHAPQSAACISEHTTVMASGASHALSMAITALANPGDNVVLPSPFFPLYGTLCSNAGIEARHYPLQPGKGWEADLAALEAAVDGKTRAILLNNPSNPCGSNFSREHVRAILGAAERLGLPVIADEVYAGLVFKEPFVSVADVECAVPRFIVSSLSKLAIAPGWRMGWIILVDPAGAAGDVLSGILDLTTLQAGPNSLIQAAVPATLAALPTHLQTVAAELAGLAEMVYDVITATCPGLRPTRPAGAMYVMVEVDLTALSFATDVAFAAALQQEEHVVVLPGTIFLAPGFVRLVITRPRPVVEEACRRMATFCEAHRRPAVAA